MLVSSTEVQSFTRRFSGLIDDGQSIVCALSTLVQQQDGDLGQVIAQVQDDVTGDGRNGATLSHAMSKHPAVWNRVYVEAVRQGENGDLKTALRRLCGA